MGLELLLLAFAVALFVGVAAVIKRSGAAVERAAKQFADAHGLELRDARVAGTIEGFACELTPHGAESLRVRLESPALAGLTVQGTTPRLPRRELTGDPDFDAVVSVERLTDALRSRLDAPGRRLVAEAVRRRVGVRDSGAQLIVGRGRDDPQALAQALERVLELARHLTPGDVARDLSDIARSDPVEAVALGAERALLARERGHQRGGLALAEPASGGLAVATEETTDGS